MLVGRFLSAHFTFAEFSTVSFLITSSVSHTDINFGTALVDFIAFENEI